jgi:hypothetical protein
VMMIVNLIIFIKMENSIYTGFSVISISTVNVIIYIIWLRVTRVDGTTEDTSLTKSDKVLKSCKFV